MDDVGARMSGIQAHQKNPVIRKQGSCQPQRPRAPVSPAHLKPPMLSPPTGSILQSDRLHPAPSPSLSSCLETNPHFNFKEGKRKGKPVDWAFCTAKQIRGLPGTCSLCSEEGRAGRGREGGKGGSALIRSR